MTDISENFTEGPETDTEWEKRRLCRDESCVGIIGSNGRCRVCGLLDPSIPKDPDLSTNSIFVRDEFDDSSSDEDQRAEYQESGWEDRKLCSDESCIGTIGTDGRCRICGLTG